MGVDAQTNRLVFLASASDFEENLTLKKSLLNKHTNIKLYSSLTDSHIYVMKNWIIKYLEHESSFSTIKGELLPHIIKKQMSKQPKAVEDKTASVINTEVCNDLFLFAKENELDAQIKDSSTFNDHVGDTKPSYHDNIVRCYALITDKAVYGLRVNNIPSYWNICSKVSEIEPETYLEFLTVFRCFRSSTCGRRCRSARS